MMNVWIKVFAIDTIVTSFVFSISVLIDESRDREKNAPGISKELKLLN